MAKATLIAAASVAAIAAIAAGGWSWWQVHQREAAVREHLVDPESARFRSARVVGGAFCGEINAKNRMGGYTGFRRFVLADSGAVYLEPDDADGSASLDSQIKDTQELIAFLQVFEAQCPGYKPTA